MTKKSKFYVDISTGAQYNHMGIQPKTGILAYTNTTQFTNNGRSKHLQSANYGS